MKEEHRYKVGKMNKFLSIITLNVNGLNASMKRTRVAEWIRKRDTQTCCLWETHLRTKDLHRLKVKGWKKIFQAKGQEKKARVAVLISDKINFQRKAIKRDWEGHFLILKGRIHKEDINIVNIYAPNMGAPKYIKKILEDFKKDIDSNPIIIGDFNTPTVKNGQIFQTKYQQRYCGTEQCPRSNELNWYILNLSSQRSKICLIFKSTWKIFKDRPYGKTQNKPQQIRENWNHIKHFLWPQGPETRNQPQRKKTQNTLNHGDWIACY